MRRNHGEGSKINVLPPPFTYSSRFDGVDDVIHPPLVDVSVVPQEGHDDMTVGR